ncbi:unnamed protein product, partial [Rotaria socialis]
PNYFSSLLNLILIIPHKSHIWCSYPCHDEVSSDGKKRCSKIGQKPSHPKGKRSINDQLALYINSHNESILDGTRTKLSEDDYLCIVVFHAQSEYIIRLMV